MTRFGGDIQPRRPGRRDRVQVKIADPLIGADHDVRRSPRACTGRGELPLCPARPIVVADEVGTVCADRNRMASGPAPHVEQRPVGLRVVVRALPGPAGVLRREDRRVVPHRDPVLRVTKAHSGEQGLRRALHLRPGSPPVVAD